MEENKYYQLPFNPSSLFKDGGEIKVCSLAESIAQNIMLLITTKQGENRYDDEYGNAVWNIEFDNKASNVLWEEIFTASLAKLLSEYETRIEYPIIKVHTSYVEHTYKTKSFSEVKKKAAIGINARLTESGERFSFSTEIFLSPMSID